ncbi:MAG: O-succinylhomoserine sulfhydrylase, partial [Betaproteobacteria bacterium]|nr:O-succinylhomoserine sulfhydrylase [Betaproteobacteria bacterium]
PQLQKVLYAGLPSHPGHALAMKQQNGMGGGIITIKLKGGRAEAWRFIGGLKLFSITANFGDAKSTATHPATTTHSRVSEEHRARIGLGEDIVRLSVGLEDVEDLREDLAQALAAV